MVALRIAGACCLAWLAWQALRPGGNSLFRPRQLPPDSPRRLFLTGLFTSLLNPKAALMDLSLLPPASNFVYDPRKGSFCRVFCRTAASDFTGELPCCEPAHVFLVNAGSLGRFCDQGKKEMATHGVRGTGGFLGGDRAGRPTRAAAE